MKLIHMSDLHLGKRYIEHSFLEDQKDILEKILREIELNQPEGIIIAGDIYDKSVPSAEAVEVFDSFLTKLAALKTPVFLISGNHDSAERIAFASHIMKESGIYISPIYAGKIEPVTLQDEYGPVNFYLVPFLKPANVRRYYPEKEINNYSDAFRVLVEEMHLNKEERNVLIAHQMISGSEVSGSEEMSVGGVESIEASVFEDFDYVALGHIHKRQTMKGKIHYCGTPLKYHFSEIKNKNGITLAELKEKGDLSLTTLYLTPQRELRELKGKFDDLMKEEFYLKQNREDYYHVILTDEEDILDGAKKLRNIYPHILKMDYDNTRTRTRSSLQAIEELEEKSVSELFEEFYERQNGLGLNEFQKDYFDKLMKEMKGEE